MNGGIGGVGNPQGRQKRILPYSDLTLRKLTSSFQKCIIKQKVSMKKSTKKFVLVVVFLLLLCLGGDFERVSAPSETGYDLVVAVNALRASYGLESYAIDYSITDYSNQYSQYQADTQTSTNENSDGMVSLPFIRG